MNFEDFKEQFSEDVKRRLDERGDEATVLVNTVEKPNESYEALTITPVGSNIGVNISIDRFYEAFSNGEPYGGIIDNVVEVIDKGVMDRPDIDIEALTDYLNVLNHRKNSEVKIL